MQEAEGKKSHGNSLRFGDIPELFVSTVSTDLQHLTTLNEVVLVFQVSVKHMAVDCNGESFCVIFWSVSLRARSDGSTLLLWLCSFWTMLAFTFHTKEIWSKYEVDKI